jgi:hypothetical protein
MAQMCQTVSLYFDYNTDDGWLIFIQYLTIQDSPGTVFT